MVRPLSNINLAMNRAPAGAGAPAYDPSGVAGLSYWIDPDDSDTVALSGSTITTIQDKVGGTSATQLESRGGVPTPDLTTISGRDWIDSNGTDEVLQLGDGTAAAVNMGSGSYTMFAVVRPTFTTGARSIFSKGFTGFYSMRSGSGVPNLALVHYFDDVGGAAFTSVSSPGAVLVQNQRHVLRFTCDRGAATISAHVDGVSVATPASIAGRGSIDDTAQNLIVCGRASGGSQAEFWQGQIGEILFYKAAVGASDITDIEAYLTAKWLA